LNAFKGKLTSKMDLAEAAMHVEQKMIRENVGSQDQTMAAFGGLNIVRFCGEWNKHICVHPVCLGQEQVESLEDRLMLFFTGFVRYASDIAAEQIRQTPKKKEELSQMHSMVDEAAKILSEQTDIDDFGRLLHEAWLLKKSLTSKITTDSIDEIYDRARSAGALGGKILGAGGGGFILFYVRPEDQARVKEALELLYVPFRFDYSGSEVIYYNPTLRE
jgi:D-glycero-alpha-D-manno-heptose-7-phosphate kinase